MGRFYLAVLETVIEDYHLRPCAILQATLFTFWQCKKLFNTLSAAFAYCNCEIGKFLFYLERFIANLLETICYSGYSESFTLPFIASRQHCNIVFFAQQPYQHFGMGSFACTTYSNVAHTYHRHRPTGALLYIFVVQKVPYL